MTGLSEDFLSERRGEAKGKDGGLPALRLAVVCLQPAAPMLLMWLEKAGTTPTLAIRVAMLDNPY